MTSWIVRFGTIAAAVGAAVGLAGTGTAAAETEVPMTRCLGLSPYIIDQPYAPARVWMIPERPGVANFAVHDVSSLWFFVDGYQSDARLDWHNLDNGRKGTVTDTATVAYPGSDAARFFVDSGPGKVQLTLSAFNRHPLWGFPTTSCTGTAQVP